MSKAFDTLRSRAQKAAARSQGAMQQAVPLRCSEIPKTKAFITLCSPVVPLLSTSKADGGLASECRWDQAVYTTYERMLKAKGRKRPLQWFTIEDDQQSSKGLTLSSDPRTNTGCVKDSTVRRFFGAGNAHPVPAAEARKFVSQQIGRSQTKPRTGSQNIQNSAFNLCAKFDERKNEQTAIAVVTALAVASSSFFSAALFGLPEQEECWQPA